MKNKFLIKVLVILNLIGLPILMAIAQKEITAYADSPSSQISVTVPDLNVREDADISSNIIGKVHQGDTFTIIASKNRWDQIKLPDNQTGWIYDAYVAPTQNIKAAVGADVLNVRERPNLSSQIVNTLKWGAKVTIYEEQSGWAYIAASSGVKGWVDEYYIVKSGTNTSQLSTNSAATSRVPDNTTEASQPINSLSLNNGGSKQNQAQPLKNKTIVLDPGHGGFDDGTTSVDGTHEKALTLATAKAVEQKLVNAGANVIMTRTNDTYIPLYQRAALSDQIHADAFISLHYNWSNDPSANGLTDFYYQKQRDDRLASDILNEVSQTTKLKMDGTSFDNLEVLRNNTQPSTLVELGFVSNKHEDSLVESSAYRNHVAQGIYLGLLEYFSIGKK